MKKCSAKDLTKVRKVRQRCEPRANVSFYVKLSTDKNIFLAVLSEILLSRLSA